MILQRSESRRVGAKAAKWSFGAASVLCTGGPGMIRTNRGEDVPSYEVKAVADSGEVLTLATVDTASAALLKLRDERARYRRVWVCDETGTEFPQEELLARSWRERNS